MAIMIPSVLSPDIKSDAEKQIYSWFENAPGTESWYVLHSLGITNHRTLLQGEADFVVLAPKMGIFVLEVKGGDVKREDGIWYFTNRYGHTNTKSRSPFDQASEAVFSIMDYIKNKLNPSHDHLRNVFFSYGVMFPDVIFNAASIEQEQWRIFDYRNKENVVDFVKKLFVEERKKWVETYGRFYEDKLPSSRDIKYLVDLLRGDFDFVEVAAIKINESEKNIVRLTKEQYSCIDQLEDNMRCLIRGAAGTGKTLLAIQSAKKFAAKNERVALFCFNNKLGEWLEYNFNSEKSTVRPAYVGTFHKFMMDVLKENNDSYDSYKKNSAKFYSEILPERALGYLESSFQGFDRIIVDEAQDLITTPYLLVLDSCLKKGLSRGKWSMFGDFEKQAIYSTGKSDDELVDLLSQEASFVNFKLNKNCRNTKQICEGTYVVGEIYRNVNTLNTIDGKSIEFKTYDTQEEELKELNDILKSLKEGQINPAEITILSPNKRSGSVVSRLKNGLINDFKINKRETITFSTIHSFKGLENTVIILVDIENYESKNLMYVGFSRARSALYVLHKKNAHQEYAELAAKRIYHGELFK